MSLENKSYFEANEIVPILKKVSNSLEWKRNNSQVSEEEKKNKTS